MKNISSYIISFSIVALALIPAINAQIPMPKEGIWFWYVLVAGFLGFYTLFLKVNIFLKILAVGSFVNCFFSSAPYFSFTSYISLIICCYFYILCSKIKDWRIIFTGLKALLLLSSLILGMQYFGNDRLLQFGIGSGTRAGLMGNHMQMGSFSVILASILSLTSPLYILFPIIVSKICSSAGALLSGFIGIFVYSLSKYGKGKNKKVGIALSILILAGLVVFSCQSGEMKSFVTGSRLQVWRISIELVNEHPITGYGIGTFKHLYHPLSQISQVPFRSAHNFLIHILFETGYPGLLFILSMLSYLFHRLSKIKNTLCLVGLAMIVTNGLVHFPDRMIQTVPLIILFLAYCTYKIKEEKYARPHSS